MKTKLLLTIAALSTTLIFRGQTPSYVPTTSLVAWYSFNGNTNDLSGNNNTLTAVNGATLAPDRFATANSSYTLDGVNDWLETMTNFYNPSTPHSIAIWWKTSDSTKTNQTLYNTSPHTTENLAFHYHSANPTPPYDLRFGLGDAAGNWNIMHPDNGAITIPPNFNVWHHAVMVRNNNNWIYYHDGKAVLTFTSALNTPTASAGLRFGAENNVPSGGAQFKGSIDDIGIWNRPLNACEVNQLYTASIATINATSSTSLICVGQSATLTGNGATSYTWNPGNLNGSTVVVSPTLTTTYTITSTNSITTCNSNTVFTQNVSTCAGLTSLASIDSNFSIFPNPSNDKITITSKSDITISIINGLGQTVKELTLSNENEHRAFVSELPNGIYFVQARNKVNSQMQKLVISK